MWFLKYPDRCTTFLLAKNYIPTWTKTSLWLVFVLRWNKKKMYIKKHYFGTILCFRQFSAHSTKFKLGLDYAKLFKMSLTLSTILNEIVEIRCWTFLTNFIPKYHCAMCIDELIIFCCQSMAKFCDEKMLGHLWSVF